MKPLMAQIKVRGTRSGARAGRTARVEDGVDALASCLDDAFCAHHKRDLVSPDPLEFLYDYPDLHDREIVGLVASCLAYGNVNQIVRSVAAALQRMPAPREFLTTTSENSVRDSCRDFKHRFTTEDDLADLLIATRRVILSYGSLGACFMKGFSEEDPTVIPALLRFTAVMKETLGNGALRLIPVVEKGSACKRLHLFLRWMVRRDAIDPGGWDLVGPPRLVIPLDTHIHRIGLALGLTRRHAADLKTALEITDAFRRISPEDPVKFDFCLTRMGMRRMELPLAGGGGLSGRPIHDP